MQGSTTSLGYQALGSTLQEHIPPPSFTIFPEELWREIFFHCLPTDEFVCPGRACAPLLLCQVCRAWRASAISMPDLWASICIGSHFDALGKFPRVELVILWLSRAKTRPLSISYGRCPLENEFAELSDEDGANADEVFEVFRILVRHIARWKSLRLHFNEMIAGSLAPIPQSGAPLLQNLCLFLSPSVEPGRYAFGDHMDDIWRNSPILDVFSFWADDILLDAHDDSLCASLHIRWDQLTTLIITASQTIPECLQLLKECPNLVDCAFHSIFAGNYNVHDRILSNLGPTPILLTSLKSLLLHHADRIPANFLTTLLLANTTMPALRQLTISGRELFSPGMFRSFVLRSSCRIEDLTFDGVSIYDSWLLACLALHSQSLVRLCIRHSDGRSGRPVKCMSDIAMKQLTIGESSAPSANAILCPKLEIIELDYAAVSAQDGFFSKMVSSRCGMEKYGIALLKKVVLGIADEAAMDRILDIRALKQLREDGVIGELRVEKIGG